MKSNNNVELYEKQNLIKSKRSSVCTVKFRYIAINVPSGEKKTLFDYFSEIKDDVDFMIHCSLHDDLIFFKGEPFMVAAYQQRESSLLKM